MGNHIVVTRAPRLKLSNNTEILRGSVYLNFVGTIVLRTAAGETQISEADDTWPKLWNDSTKVYIFKNFGEMCKWVSNGRRLEDLQGDASKEYVVSAQLKKDQYSVLMSGGSHRSDLIGKVFLLGRKGAGDFPLWNLTDGYGFRIDAVTDCLFWPLNPELGDSITITAQP